jgi:hypothetical protein
MRGHCAPDWGGLPLFSVAVLVANRTAVGATVLLARSAGLLSATVAWAASLLPRWLTLGAAGLLLLVVGATCEGRRHQAREAVAWVAQMR